MNTLKAFTVFILVVILCTISYASDNANKPPRILTEYVPQYPIEQMIALTEGKVIIRLIITKGGEVKDPEIFKSEPKGVFDKAALKAIVNYAFEPAIKNGKPVDSIVKVPIIFSITKPDAEIIKKASKSNAKGLKYMKAGKYEKAIKKYTKAIDIFKEYIPAYIGRGKVHMSQGKYGEAILDFDAAIKIDPEAGLYYSLRGQAYKKLKDTENMCLDLKRPVNWGTAGKLILQQRQENVVMVRLLQGNELI